MGDIMKDMTTDVKATFDSLPVGLLQLRALIFDVASGLPEIGTLTETLRWGQPAYVTSKRAGASLRLGAPKSGGFALYTHCQTPLIADFAMAFPKEDKIDGTRAILFDEPSQIDPIRHGMLIKSVLTYHL
ncbi:MAG: hypothetical protein ACI82I_000763 [Gammaproteobacteria bacterium]|jgi:hypothetical protein